MNIAAMSFSLVIAIVVCACSSDNTESNVGTARSEESVKVKLLGMPAMQGKDASRKLNAYMDSFHFYRRGPEGLVEAHHLCGRLNEDLIQCTIFDSKGHKGKIMGVEYIVPRAVFGKLPVGEKNRWHSHVRHVRSSQLTVDGIPEVAKRAVKKDFAATYGTTCKRSRPTARCRFGSR